MMPVQYTPQQLLNHIHATGYDGLYKSDMATKERLADLKLTRQKLKAVKQALKIEQDAIKKRWDGRKSDEAERERIELAPYSVIQQVHDDTETALLELENAAKFDREIPVRIEYGKVFAGDERYMKWGIFDDDAKAKAWVEAQERILRINALSIKRREIRAVIENIETRGKIANSELRRHQQWSPLAGMGIVAMCGVIGLIFIATGLSWKLANDATLGALFGGVLFFVVGLVRLYTVGIYAMKTRPNAITSLTAELEELKAERKNRQKSLKSIDTELEELMALNEQESVS